MTTDNNLPPTNTPKELHRKERGHAFYPPAGVLAKLPQLYSTEDVPLAEKIIRLHFFAGACDWWVVEYDPAERLAFGYACLGDPDCAEWGYVSLTELEAVYREAERLDWPCDSSAFAIRPPIIVERDLHWVPCTVKEARLPGRPM